MRPVRHRAGFTITELLAVIVAITLLLAAILPSIARAQSSSGVQQSMSNLVTLGVSHVLYALDWDDRQVTWVKDDLGVYDGDVQEYNYAGGDCTGPFPYRPEECQPPLYAGRGCEGWYWGIWPSSGSSLMFQPIAFPPLSSGYSEGWGHWRAPNLKPFHDYVYGRYNDAVYYAPDDWHRYGDIEVCLDSPCEFIGHINTCNAGWSSYGMSPAAMLHPDVMRSNADGGWQAPWDLDLGYQSPGLFQATYPDLKTHMIEHNWIRDPPGECNPAVPTLCEPYYFNQGIDAAPVTLFYDGSARVLPNTEAFAADQQVLQATGGVDGLWHRGTSFGETGYRISHSFDGTPLSHHVLTTDGILGRDTLGSPPPQPIRALRMQGGFRTSFQTADPEVPIADPDLFKFTPAAGDEP